jgi:hypothetical protein
VASKWPFKPLSPRDNIVTLPTPSQVTPSQESVQGSPTSQLSLRVQLTPSVALKRLTRAVRCWTVVSTAEMHTTWRHKHINNTHTSGNGGESERVSTIVIYRTAVKWKVWRDIYVGWELRGKYNYMYIICRSFGGPSKEGMWYPTGMDIK